MVPAAASIVPRRLRLMLLLRLRLRLLLVIIVDTNTAKDDDGVFGVVRGAFAQWTQFIPVVVCVHRRTGRVSHRNGVFRVRSFVRYVLSPTMCFRVRALSLSLALSRLRTLNITRAWLSLALLFWFGFLFPS